MDMMDAPKPKRFRKPNFTATECTVLLENIFLEKHILMSALTTETTNKKKTETWRKIAAQVSTCGNACRSVEDVRDKWKNLKSETLRRVQDQTKTGGGPPKTASPYEDLVLSILGRETSLTNGMPCTMPDVFKDAASLSNSMARNNSKSTVSASGPIAHSTPNKICLQLQDQKTELPKVFNFQYPAVEQNGTVPHAELVQDIFSEDEAVGVLVEHEDLNVPGTEQIILVNAVTPIKRHPLAPVADIGKANKSLGKKKGKKKYHNDCDEEEQAYINYLKSNATKNAVLERVLLAKEKLLLVQERVLVLKEKKMKMEIEEMEMLRNVNVKNSC